MQFGNNMQNQVCPHCGRCPHCGQGGNQFYQGGQLGNQMGLANYEFGKLPSQIGTAWNPSHNDPNSVLQSTK